MRRIYFELDRVESVDKLMKNRSLWCSRTEQWRWRVIRTLPKDVPFYDRCVTGLKIKIGQSIHSEKVNDFDLRKRFDRFGRILHCQWINEEETEALFTFAEYGSNIFIYIFIHFFIFSYDSVDQIILTHSSLEIKQNKITLEKVPTGIPYR